MNINVIFGSLFGILCLETILLMFIFIKTPAAKFLVASLFKKPLLYIIGKDRIGYFKSFDSRNGAANIGKDGLYNLTENSHTLEAGSKIPIYFAFRDLAATLLPEYPAIIQELREQGVVLNKIEDVTDYIEEIKKGIKRDLPIEVKPYKTYKFHELGHMFPNNIDPTFIKATVQYQISKGLKITQNMPMIMGSAVALLVAAGVAIFIINKAFKGSMDPGDCQAMVAAAKCTTQPLIQAINNSPIIP